MSRHELAPAAEADLAEIVDRVARSSGIDAAERLLATMLAAFERIAESPRIGHRRAHWTGARVRFWIVYRFFVIHDSESDPIRVIRIWHAARAPWLLDEAIRGDAYDGRD